MLTTCWYHMTNSFQYLIILYYTQSTAEIWFNVIANIVTANIRYEGCLPVTEQCFRQSTSYSIIILKLLQRMDFMAANTGYVSC